jgi:hypothetical protein
MNEGQVYRLLTQLPGLEEAGRVAGNDHVVRFAQACTTFMQHVADTETFGDVRVVNVLDSANLTLQTATAAVVAGENDSLESTIELLRQPRSILD